MTAAASIRSTPWSRLSASSDQSNVRRAARSLWERAWLELGCLDSCVEVHTCVSGRGALTGARLLGGRSAIPGTHLGPTHSGTMLRTLLSPNPEDGLRRSDPSPRAL